MNEAFKILEEIKEYSQTLNPEVKKIRLSEIRSNLKNLSSKEIEYLFNQVDSNPNIFPEETAEEIKFEYVHRGGKLHAKQQYPEPTVGALIFNQEDKILLIKSHKWRGKYTIPGGHIELGERMEDALKREIKEETGLEIYDVEFIRFDEFIFDEAFWEKKHFIFFDFACKTNSTEVKLNSEAQEYVWVSLEEALEFPVEPYAKRTIEEYIKKRKAFK
jgi:nucleoside triphosphatase